MSTRRRSDWLSAGTSDSMPAKALETVVRKRRQMLVHCHLYYRLDISIISDHQWQLWADQLVALQARYGSAVGFYDWSFHDWDASTGYHLPTDPDIERVALRCHRYAMTPAQQP